MKTLLRSSYGNIVDQVSLITKLICFSLILIMYVVTFGPVVNKYYSEVGEPYDGYTYNDWYIEPGDEVTRENEVLKIYGDLIIQPGGNLSLINCELLFHHPVSGNFLLHVQKNDTSGISGELFLQGTKVSVINESGGYYYDFQIDGNAVLDSCDISYVGTSGFVGGIQVNNDNVTITGCEIHKNEK